MPTPVPRREAERQLRGFIAKFDPHRQALIRALRRALRKRFPTAHELVYDNYNFFAIGYSPSERPSEAFVSLAAAARGVSVCFIHGARLPDPAGLLQGSGKQTRFMRCPTGQTLDAPAAQALLAAAAAGLEDGLPPTGRGRLEIRAVAKNQRPGGRRADLSCQPRAGIQTGPSMKPKEDPALVVRYGVIAHVALLWLGYLAVRSFPVHALVIGWVGLGVLWIAWPIVIIIQFRKIECLIALMVSGLAWAPLALPITTYLAWATHGFGPR